MPLTPRQTRRIVVTAAGHTKKLSHIKNVLTDKYPKLNEQEQIDDEIREILYDCSIHFKDDVKAEGKKSYT